MKLKMEVGAESPFHESYFAHPCTVLTERDVLITDIKGDRCWQKFLRCWHDMFLLSYSNERCRIFFNSSQTLRLERAHHFRYFRDRIHPLSKFYEAWSVVILVTTVVNRFLFHRNTALIFGKQSKTLIVMGIVTEMIALFDIYIHFRTGYVDLVTRKVVLGYWEGFVHYSSTKLFLDAAAAIPFQTIMLLRYGLSVCALCRSNTFVCCIKVLSIIGFYRLYNVSEYLGRERENFKSLQICKFLRLFIIAITSMLQLLNLFDTINILIVIHSGHVPPKSYFTMVMRVRHILNDIPHVFLLCVEFSILIKSVLLHGYSIFRHDFYVDKMFGLLCLVYSIWFICCTAIEFFSVITREKLSTNQFTKHKKRTFHWMRCQQLSEMIKDKVYEYFEYEPSRIILLERDNQYYYCLPTIINRELKLVSGYRLLRRIPFFSEWPVSVVEELVMYLNGEVFLTNDVIAHPFTQGDGLVIVEAGVLAVYSSSMRETGHLIDGDYFGELSLITDTEIRTSAVVAVTFCKLQILSKGIFRRIMRKHTDLFFELQKTLREKFEKRISEITIPASFNLDTIPRGSSDTRPKL